MTMAENVRRMDKLKVNQPNSVEEIQGKSDMVTMLDKAIEKLDEDRFALVITISKDGDVSFNDAGFVSELELLGLKLALPDIMDAIICGRCEAGCEDNGEEV